MEQSTKTVEKLTRTIQELIKNNSKLNKNNGQINNDNETINKDNGTINNDKRWSNYENGKIKKEKVKIDQSINSLIVKHFTSTVFKQNNNSNELLQRSQEEATKLMMSTGSPIN